MKDICNKNKILYFKYSNSLKGKIIAVTGTTGGIGRPLCRYLAELGASLILLDRNYQKSNKLREELLRDFDKISVKCINLELEDIHSVKETVKELKNENIDIFIHNAGAYAIPRHICSTGYDNVFQINFVSPYYMIRELMPELKKKNGRVVAVGSIAHNYSKTNPMDIDFSSCSKASKVYGNAKRYLVFSLYELFKDEKGVSLAITHPGITFTNITAHYPKLIFAIIKNPMKVIFMKPQKASLSVVKGVFEDCSYHEWIGPRIFGIWGFPYKTRLKTVKLMESQNIGKSAENIYNTLKKFENFQDFVSLSGLHIGINRL